MAGKTSESIFSWESIIAFAIIIGMKFLSGVLSKFSGKTIDHFHQRIKGAFSG